MCDINATLLGSGYMLRHASSWDMSKTIPSLHVESMVTDSITVSLYIYSVITGTLSLFFNRLRDSNTIFHRISDDFPWLWQKVTGRREPRGGVPVIYLVNYTDWYF